ncbi:MAG: DegT/DnrJ/EryC1/StrS family aminotransferase [Lachnospiraceae bacterium]|jgi:UDP-2-acetamido-2-deoxy-ribo-hexuluronate aminotransferase|nr:DegT/DnrJ/EryC1/StrS family aminotransferase [Lachnospiraceae bacterium]
MEFKDLKSQYQYLKPQIDEAVQKVMEKAEFIGGGQVQKLEEELAFYVGKKYCITCGNGTDALSLALKIWEVGEGDAVFVPDFTFFSSGECPANEGATPIFVDVNKNTYNIEPDCLEKAIIKVLHDGVLVPKVVIAVDLFGQPAEYDKIKNLCNKYSLYLLEDGAQGFGGAINGKMACSFGDISTTSFFPAKPLGGYGDGGAIFTDNEEWALLLRSIAVHGKNAADKYDNIRLGINSRLDSLQAAILRVKLKAFKEYELETVNRVAEWYGENLINTHLHLPTVKQTYISSWAQYTIRVGKDMNRDALQKYLTHQGIPTMVYYKKPMHMQGAFKNTESAKSVCPMTTELCDTVLSLPMHPYMKINDVKLVAEKIKEFC